MRSISPSQLAVVLTLATATLVAPSRAYAQGSLVSWGQEDWGEISLTPAGDDFIAVAAGNDHSVALRADGSLVAWGRNYWGAVVADTPTDHDFVDVEAAGFVSIARRRDGSLVAWGMDSWGQVSLAPTRPGFVDVAIAGWYCIALGSDGSLVVWGNGMGTTHHEIAEPPPGNDFVDVAAGAFHAVALRTDGTLVSWGADPSRYGVISGTPRGNGFVAVSAGYYFSVALHADGTVVTWGTPDVAGSSPTEPGLVSLAPSGLSPFTCGGLRADGRIAAWGYEGADTNGPWGNISETPMEPGFIDVAIGYVHGIGIRSSAPTDSDGDGLSDADEINRYGTDPRNRDTDGDGLWDGTEVSDTGTNPLLPDTDLDGCTDGDEVHTTGTDPLSPDTDLDGVWDCTDDMPLDPGVSSGQLEDMTRALGDLIQLTDLSSFNGANANADEGRRNALANRATAAANAIAAGDTLAAVEALESLIAKVDGVEPEPDWMHDSPEKDQLEADATLLLALLTM